MLTDFQYIVEFLILTNVAYTTLDYCSETGIHSNRTMQSIDPIRTNMDAYLRKEYECLENKENIFLAKFHYLRLVNFR